MNKQIGYYNYTVVLTYCGMLLALAGIFAAWNDHFCGSMLCLMLAGVCDMFDGSVAATRQRTRQEKSFGIQIDSLSDLVSFGVLPGLFVYELLERNIWAGITAGLFVLAALIRLAYFNVLEEERQQKTTERRRSYLGLPVTSIAVILPVAWLLYDEGLAQAKALFPAVLLMTAAGFLAPVEIKKPAALGKAGLIVLGGLEMAGLLFLMGGDPL